jgi:hypothetical protein
MRRLAIIGGGTGMLAACLVFVPVALAGRTHLNSFHLRGTNGYRIKVEASQSPGSVIPGHRPFQLNRHKGAVTVTVTKGHASSAYSVPATVTRTRIRARLRGFGRIRVKFNLGVRAKGPAKRGGICSESEVIKLGSFRGRIRFRGEHGYTQAKRHSAPGGIGYHQRHCSGTPGEPPIELTELVARSETTRFLALGSGGHGRLFQASERVKLGRVLINRSAVHFTRDPSEFSFDPGLTTAHVEPLGSAFSGSADFAAPSQWTGSLAVSFPGAPNAPLTGPDFTAKLKKVTFKRR